jgi:D-glycero-alpha-D-manno-heptose-7-phosphate kinase
VTINKYAFAALELQSNAIEIDAKDIWLKKKYEISPVLDYDGQLDLLKGIYNVIVKRYNGGRGFGFRLVTWSDVPMGSGLGGSSAIAVSTLKAFLVALGIELDSYEFAKLAYEIERLEVGLKGGKQDQYAAVFGGCNFMEFGREDRVLINPLRVQKKVSAELESSLLLHFSGQSREGERIIRQQIEGFSDSRLNHMRKLKADAHKMKECLLQGSIAGIAEVMNGSWESKKLTADGVTNPMIDEIYEAGRASGAMAGKVSGAGGGGFIMFLVDPVKRADVVKALSIYPGFSETVSFTLEGVEAWRI